ncbi:hypothetical protein AB0N23_13355 [Streptomyces sp. NPDC052644]
MAAAAYLVIRCDAPDPDEYGGQCSAEGSSPRPVATHTELRGLLREVGWRRRRVGRTLLDLCPDHADAFDRASERRFIPLIGYARSPARRDTPAGRPIHNVLETL